MPTIAARKRPFALSAGRHTVGYLGYGRHLLLTNLIQHRVFSQGLELSVLELPANKPSASPLIIVHGLRDCAQAFVPLATNHLTDIHRVLLPDHRGHGLSPHSDAYAVGNFLLDLHNVIITLADGPVALLGHSLGGHIVSQYAALFPELVTRVIIVEGLGPPKRPHEGNEVLEAQTYRHMLLEWLSPSTSKDLGSLASAASRLKRNNPRLPEAEALRLAEHLTRRENEHLHWNFDSRANSVFLGKRREQDAAYWRQVKAPTCIVSGTLSYEYWGRQMAQDNFTGQFAEGEMEARADEFPHHEHHWFDKSGHMVHYDEPDRLGTLCRKFLEKTDV